jgi:hypothetical protein
MEASIKEKWKGTNQTDQVSVTGDSKRQKRIEIRLSNEEYETICQKAFKTRLQIAVYLRECGLNKKLQETLPIAELKKLQEQNRMISGLGNNLNQVVKKMHQEGFVKNAKEITELINKLQTIIY